MVSRHLNSMNNEVCMWSAEMWIHGAGNWAIDDLEGYTSFRTSNEGQLILPKASVLRAITDMISTLGGSTFYTREDM